MRDALGNIRTVTDSSVSLQESRLYSPYGEPYGTTGSSQTTYGFTGEPTDSTGLVNLRARYYNPALGQFFNLDPKETPNRYAYVEGNPVNATDPTGLTMYIDADDGTGDYVIVTNNGTQIYVEGGGTQNPTTVSSGPSPTQSPAPAPSTSPDQDYLTPQQIQERAEHRRNQRINSLQNNDNDMPLVGTIQLGSDNLADRLRDFAYNAREEGGIRGIALTIWANIGGTTAGVEIIIPLPWYYRSGTVRINRWTHTTFVTDLINVQPYRPSPFRLPSPALPGERARLSTIGGTPGCIFSSDIAFNTNIPRVGVNVVPMRCEGAMATREITAANELAGERWRQDLRNRGWITHDSPADARVLQGEYQPRLGVPEIPELRDNIRLPIEERVSPGAIQEWNLTHTGPAPLNRLDEMFPQRRPREEYEPISQEALNEFAIYALGALVLGGAVYVAGPTIIGGLLAGGGAVAERVRIGQ